MGNLPQAAEQRKQNQEPAFGLSDHIIERLIEKIGADEDRLEVENLKHKRRFDLVYACLLIGLFVFLTVYLAGEQGDLYGQILLALAMFGSGFVAGKGYKTTRLTHS